MTRSKLIKFTQLEFLLAQCKQVSWLHFNGVKSFSGQKLIFNASMGLYTDRYILLRKSPFLNYVCSQLPPKLFCSSMQAPAFQCLAVNCMIYMPQNFSDIKTSQDRNLSSLHKWEHYSPIQLFCHMNLSF